MNFILNRDRLAILDETEDYYKVYFSEGIGQVELQHRVVIEELRAKPQLYGRIAWVPKHLVEFSNPIRIWYSAKGKKFKMSFFYFPFNKTGWMQILGGEQ